MPRIISKLLLVSFLWLLLAPVSYAVVVRNLSDEWLVYNQESGNYLPYDATVDYQTTTVSTWLYPGKDDYLLELTLPVGTSVFFNNHLWYQVKSSKTQHLALKDILQLESREKKPVLLTLFNPDGALEIFQVGIVNEARPTLVQPKYAKADQASIALPKTSLRDGSGLILISIMLLFAFVRGLDPREFGQLLSVPDLLTNPFEGYGGASIKVWTPTNMFLMAGNVLTIVFVFSMTDRFEAATTILNQLISLLNQTGTTVAIFTLMVIAGLGYYAFKYLLVVFSGYMFQMGRYTNVHFIEFLRLSTFLSLGLLCLLVAVYNAFFLTFSEFWVGFYLVVLLFFLIRIVKLFWIGLASAEIRMLYLIAYLCMTEIVPMVLLMRLLVPQD